jgi:hypothetical protein
MHLLLTGAGFSRNWGGWLAKELEGDLLGRLVGHEPTRKLVQTEENFERALEKAGTHDSPAADRQLLVRAIRESFGAMNNAYVARGILIFAGENSYSVSTFLEHFDSIFTLNQDALLEILYDPSPSQTRRWDGVDYPGIRPYGQRPSTPAEKAAARFKVGDIESVGSRFQPIYKLHGSVNWDAQDEDLFIVGGGKAEAIQRHPLLRAYLDQFRSMLRITGCRLMVIGYGFGDEHINKEIVEASVENPTLSLFHVHPDGRDAVHQGKRERLSIYVPPTIASVPCCGESRRPLSSTFSNDELEYKKVMRFFT